MAMSEKEKSSVKLTEALVLARTRAADLESVRKLNCWACQIGEATIVRRMPNLEVCSLSVNNLTTLQDFEHCPNLQELYIRKNRVANLSDVTYLKNLQRLRALWLSDNPCAERDNYRMTVLRTLPNLQKLDNIVVTEEELNKALEEGDDLEQLEPQNPDPDLSTDFNSNNSDNPSHATPQTATSVDPSIDTSVSTSVDTTPAVDTSSNCNASVDLLSSEDKEEAYDSDSEQRDTEGDNVLTASAVEIKLDTLQSEVPADNEKSGLVCCEPSEGGSGADPDDTVHPVSGETSEDTGASAQSVPSANRSEVGHGKLAHHTNPEPSEGEPTMSPSAAKSHRDQLQQESVKLSWEETNHIRSQLGLKPLPMSKITPHRSVTTGITRARNANILQSVLLLTRELDKDSLEILHDAVRKRLEDM